MKQVRHCLLFFRSSLSKRSMMTHRFPPHPSPNPGNRPSRLFFPEAKTPPENGGLTALGE
jgi:hypothetical protein